MPELRPKNQSTINYIAENFEGLEYTMEPAIKRFVGAFEEYPYEYTTDLEASGFVNAAVKLTFADSDKSVLFLDSDEVIV